MLARQIKPVPPPAHSDKVARFPWVGLDLGTQAIYRAIEPTFFINIIIDTQNMVGDLLAGMECARRLREKCKDLELLRRQLNPPTA